MALQIAEQEICYNQHYFLMYSKEKQFVPAVITILMVFYLLSNSLLFTKLSSNSQEV